MTYTQREALDRIAALCDDAMWSGGYDMALEGAAEDLRSVLAEVEPEQPDPRLTAIDKDALVARLSSINWADASRRMDRDRFWSDCADLVIEALAGVRPVALDREQARKVIDLWDGGRIDLDGLLDRLAACVRPVDGVLVLTRDEAAIAAGALHWASGRTPSSSARAALAARLEREASALSE